MVATRYWVTAAMAAKEMSIPPAIKTTSNPAAMIAMTE